MQQQHYGVASSIACHSGTDFAGVFLPQVQYYDGDPRAARGLFDPSDMVAAPYSCNGGAAVGAVPPGRAVEGCRNGEERKRRRLASNRESARRSRVRKQRRLDELSSRAARLQAANQRLLVELNRVAAEHVRVVRENARLTEEARELQGKLDAMEVEEGAEAAAAQPQRTPKIA